MINVFQPALGMEELKAIAKVFESNWVGKGRITAQFESAFAAHVSADKALMQSVSSCTEGLFQSMTVTRILRVLVRDGVRPILGDVQEEIPAQMDAQ